MFSCEFCEISKNTFFTEHLWTNASDHMYQLSHKTEFIEKYFLKVSSRVVETKRNPFKVISHDKETIPINWRKRSS